MSYTTQRTFTSHSDCKQSICNAVHNHELGFLLLLVASMSAHLVLMHQRGIGDNPMLVQKVDMPLPVAAHSILPGPLMTMVLKKRLALAAAVKSTAVLLMRA